MTIPAYITEEVHRQGFKRGTAIHTEMCINMAMAWAEAQAFDEPVSVTPEMVLRLGALIMPDTNSGGFRKYNVTIRGQEHVRFAPWEEVPRLVEAWCWAINDGALDANTAYVAFEEIHPFGDGNGRTGKVLFNRLNGTLAEPVWPKSPKEWRIP